jgi:dTDP-4-dehydrorhamnose reductase
VIGSHGLLGKELTQLLRERGQEVVGFDRFKLNLEHIAFEDIVETFHCIDVIVNVAAYTAVDKAESESALANVINGVAPGKLAQAAAAVNSRFIHVSTDYVFSGRSTIPYKTDDKVDPQTEYGRSKALGELQVAESGADYSIIRTAWLYGAGGRCFPKTMATLIQSKGIARVVNDQHGQPTWTRDLAELVLACAELESMPRIVHGVSSGVATWADFAGEVALSLGLDPDEVIESVKSDEFPTAAIRPKCSVLDNSSSLLKPIGDWRERWRVASAEVLASR